MGAINCEPGIGSVLRIMQSTHPVRGGTTGAAHTPAPTRISIHPPRAGWDEIMTANGGMTIEISIHPPRAGWDSKHIQNDMFFIGYQQQKKPYIAIQITQRTDMS